MAFVTPPYQQAFDLWYEPDKLQATLLALCPAADDPVRKRLAAGESVVLVPTVGGKTADTMRIVCSGDAAASFR